MREAERLAHIVEDLLDLSTVEAAIVSVTGTTTITALGTLTAGIQRVLIFAGALTLTHNATSLILPSGVNITTAAGDVAWMVSEGSGNWRCLAYTRANGQALIANGVGLGTWGLASYAVGAGIDRGHGRAGGDRRAGRQDHAGW